jgi:hypothetical protein
MLTNPSAHSLVKFRAIRNNVGAGKLGGLES